eukprot:6492450-Amphidinium_carterae.2
MPSSSTTPAKKSALHSAREDDGSVAKRPKRRADLSIEAMVEKALKDHCKRWSAFRINVYVPPETGMTFRKYLEWAKTEWKAGRLSMGSKWWSRMDSVYTCPDEAEPSLSISRFENVTEDTLFRHFMMLMADPPKREPMIAWLQKTTSMTEMQYVIVVKALMLLNLRGMGNQYETGVTIVKCIHRCRVHEAHGEIHKASFATVDKWLLQAEKMNPESE